MAAKRRKNRKMGKEDMKQGLLERFPLSASKDHIMGWKCLLKQHDYYFQAF